MEGDLKTTFEFSAVSSSRRHRNPRCGRRSWSVDPVVPPGPKKLLQIVRNGVLLLKDGLSRNPRTQGPRRNVDPDPAGFSL